MSARVEANHNYIILVDGLDECMTGEIEEVIQCLARLCRIHPEIIKIVLASRPDQEKLFRRLLNINYKMSVTEAKTREDIACYIHTVLDQCLEDRKLTLSKAALILDISETLERGAQGM